MSSLVSRFVFLLVSRFDPIRTKTKKSRLMDSSCLAPDDNQGQNDVMALVLCALVSPDGRVSNRGVHEQILIYSFTAFSRVVGGRSRYRIAVSIGE